MSSYIELFGDPQENFFSLGRKDKNSYQDIYQQISMLCARNNVLAQLLKLSTEFASKWNNKTDTKLIAEIKAYAEGLERPVDDVIFSLLLPELVASFNKWTPQLIQLIPGCSSLFFLDDKTQTPVHGRILDYALSGPFEKYERALKYDFKGKNKVFSFSSSGLPFPSLTGINDQGLSLALHYKHGSYFDIHGESIFSITQEILFTCGDISEAMKLLRKKSSTSYWGIYLSDKNNQVASIDICGKDLYQEKFDLADHPYLYFNNRPLLDKKANQKLQPYGNPNQCHMRTNQLQTNMSQLKEKSLNSSLQALASIPETKKLNQWNLGPLTPSSIQVVSMNAMAKQCLQISGEAPKIYKDQYLHYSDIFSQLNSEEKTSRKKLKKHELAFKRWSSFQTALDLGNIPKAYHEIQMAIELFDTPPEKHISQFFFYATEFIYESDKRDYSYILEDFESLKDKLPEYLEDHRQLFIMRISKIIGLEVKADDFKIRHPELKKRFQDEFQLNALAIKGLKKLTFPRLEILDIIYAY